MSYFSPNSTAKMAKTVMSVKIELVVVLVIVCARYKKREINSL